MSYRPPMHQRALPAHLKNYVILSPPKTHWRPASSCEEANCRRWTDGWETVFDESTDDGKRGAAYVRSRRHGNQFTEWRQERSSIVTFRFPPHQPNVFCHMRGKHLIRLERPEFFGVRDVTTDFKLKLHDGAENGAVNWAHDFATNQDAVDKKVKEGYGNDD
jgi:hypothetical protein